MQGVTAAVQKANLSAQVVFDACGTSTTATTAATSVTVHSATATTSGPGVLPMNLRP